MLHFLKPTATVKSGYQHFKVSADDITLIGDGKNQQEKFTLVNTTIMPLISGLSVLDIGASNGLYTFSALVHGAKSVTALDNEREIVGGRSLQHLREIADKIGFTNLTTIQSCFSKHQEQHDVVLCLAVMHHLFYASEKSYKNLHDLVKHLAASTNKHLIIEWVDPRGGGPYAQEKPYSKQEFLKNLDSNFKHVKFLGVTNHYSNLARNDRELYFCSKAI